MIVAARASYERARMISDVEWVPEPGGEASVAMECFSRLAPHIPGAHGIIYDTWAEAPARAGASDGGRLAAQSTESLRRSRGRQVPRGHGRRVEKSIHIEDRDKASLLRSDYEAKDAWARLRTN